MLIGFLLNPPVTLKSQAKGFRHNVKSIGYDTSSCGNPLWEASWPHSSCDGLRSERSGIEPWPENRTVFLSKTRALSIAMPFEERERKRESLSCVNLRFCLG